MGFKKAVRDDIFAKVLFISPSGGGKSFSALRVAKGMAKALEDKMGEEVRVAYIGTENSRDTYYADEFDYDLLQIKNDYKPENYIDALDDAIEAGYKVCIVDSLSHEWTGKGGCLEIHSKIQGNSYTAWQKVTPRHEKFMDKLLESDIHIIATVRGKDKYVLTEENGKQIPKKVGLGYQQRDDLEYLFTTAFTLEQDNHVFTAVKDNTHLFEDRNDIITEKDGVAIIDWCSGGDVKAKKQELQKEKEKAMEKIKLNEEKEAEKLTEESKKKKTAKKKDQSLDGLKKQIVELCAELSNNGKRDGVVALMKELAGTPNPNKIEDMEVAEKVLEALQGLE